LTKTKATAIGPSGEPYTPLEKQVCWSCPGIPYV
jgi:hypothetical protein